MRLGQSGGGTDNPELLVGILAVLGLVCFGVWAFLEFVRRKPVPPDPWNEGIATEIEREEAVPLCHRCLTAHESSADFCPKCGAAVGQYTNWLPFPYLFSVGDTLRIGTSGEFRRSPLTVCGFFLFSLVEYTIFAPVYWCLMLWRLRKRSAMDGGHDQSPPALGEASP